MISRTKKRAILLATSMVFAAVTVGVYAIPQTADFVYRSGFWYDSWGYTRNYAEGVNGFVPNLAYEVLGKWRGTALDWGGRFAEEYFDRSQRAEAILRFVQEWTDYGYDEDNVVMNGIRQEEWAWNGDETASRIDLDSGTLAIGDCEDLAFFCSALYEGAGFDTAIVLTTDHAALLIWLPEYPKVLKWDLEGDGREYGWIWVESTGENNPLGWTPSVYRDGDWEAFVVEQLYIHETQFYPTTPSSENDVTVTTSVLHRTSSLEKVTLSYSVDGKSHELEMNSIGDERFRTVIPKQSDGAVVEFEVHALDSIGYVKKTDPLSYQVGKKGFELPVYLSNTALILVAIGAIILVLMLL